jgi:thiamine-monophosphate kinase
VLTRAGARPGDAVFVTGTLGDAIVGLKSLRAQAGVDVAEERFLRPEPRIRAGILLGRNRAATSCMDLSDGLADGLRQIGRASGVGMTIEGDKLPISDVARSWHASQGTDEITGALDGGDDYELLFTARSARQGRLQDVRRGMGELQVTRIGVVTREPRLVVRTPSGEREVSDGYEHFRG